MPHLSRSNTRAQIVLENIAPPIAMAGMANLCAESLGCNDTAIKPSPLKIFTFTVSYFPSIPKSN